MRLFFIGCVLLAFLSQPAFARGDLVAQCSLNHPNPSDSSGILQVFKVDDVEGTFEVVESTRDGLTVFHTQMMEGYSSASSIFGVPTLAFYASERFNQHSKYKIKRINIEIWPGDQATGKLEGTKYPGTVGPSVEELFCTFINENI